MQDRVAQVWMPYDLYIGTAWSHCGVDTFTLMKREGRWRVAALVYTIEQPPACSRHPMGPPADDFNDLFADRVSKASKQGPSLSS